MAVFHIMLGKREHTLNLLTAPTAGEIPYLVNLFFCSQLNSIVSNAIFFTILSELLFSN